jgi:hypothetical protein
MLDAVSAAVCAAVCREWHFLLNRDSVWKSVFIRKWSNGIHHKLKTGIKCCHDDVTPTVPTGETWKEKFRLETRWRNGKFITYPLEGLVPW